MAQRTLVHTFNRPDRTEIHDTEAGRNAAWAGLLMCRAHTGSVLFGSAETIAAL